MALTQVSTGGIKDGQVHTADLADSQITAGKLHADALDHTYTLGASGTDHYTFTGEGLTGAVNDATLYLTRGKTYRFVNGNSSGAHPFRIQSVAGAGGTEYNTGVTNNAGAGGSTIIFEVPHDAPDVLYYICTSHATMNGIFYVTGALADGTVTTAKLAADAVTQAKIADDAVGADQLASSAVVTASIVDDAVTADKLANSINTEITANTAKTSNATHTGEVTGGTALTIADDVVDEANLKISNTPTNGYFLSAQSGNTGGLTWAEASGGLDGVTTGSGNVTITDGDLIFASGHGIDFSAYHDSSTGTVGSQVLHDYEEGTFTPTARGHSSNSSPVIEGTGTYTKIGRTVLIQIHFSNENGSYLPGGEYLQIHGLPFTADGTQFAPYGFNYKLVFDSSKQYNFYIQSNSTIMWAYKNQSDQPYTPQTTTEWDNTQWYHENTFTYQATY